MRIKTIYEWSGAQSFAMSRDSVESAILSAGDVAVDAKSRVLDTITDDDVFNLHTGLQTEESGSPMNVWYGSDINYGYDKTLIITLKYTTNQLVFTYAKQALVDSFQRQNMVAQNSIDGTVAYTLSAYTKVDIVYGDTGLKGTGDFSIFYHVREVGDIKQATLLYNFSSINGSASWSLALPDILFDPNKTYVMTATYRDGIFTTTQFPTVLATILADADETRVYTIEYGSSGLNDSNVLTDVGPHMDFFANPE